MRSLAPRTKRPALCFAKPVINTMKTLIFRLPLRLRIAFGSIIVLGIVAMLAPGHPGPVDLSTGKPLADARVIWPLWRYAIEPFAAAAEYVLSFSRYIVQLCSWLAWLGTAAFIRTMLRKKKAGPSARAALIAMLAVISAVLLALILPFPAPRLSVENGKVVDLHSHTYYSHDGVMSPAQSLFFHRRLGFDSFFVTEHGHTDGFPHFSKEISGKEALPGMQISTKERVSLLVLADRPFDGRPYRDKTAREVIDKAHAAGFVVICPHWWKWRHFTWEELRQKGIDGFEVYNAGYRNFSDEERGRMTAFCRANGLVTTSSTDWHGWGYMSDAWTVLPDMEKNAGAAEVLGRLKEHGPMTPAALRRPQASGALRHIFEPFFGVYYYLSTLSVGRWLGWSLWILVFAMLAPLGATRVFLSKIPLILGCLFAALAVYALVLWAPLLPENMILGRLLAPILSVIAACWAGIYLMRQS